MIHGSYSSIWNPKIEASDIVAGIILSPIILFYYVCSLVLMFPFRIIANWLNK